MIGKIFSLVAVPTLKKYFHDYTWRHHPPTYMHTYNIRIMISTIYAEDREDMESIFVSKNSAIIKQEKTLLTFTLRWLWDLWIIFHFIFGIKEIEIEFALYDNDRIAKIEILCSFTIGSTSTLHLSLTFSNIRIKNILIIQKYAWKVMLANPFELFYFN